MIKQECDFCCIGTEPDRIIRRGRHATSFLSNPRLTLGHTLVIPNRHVTSPDRLRDKEVLAIHHEASRVGSILLGRTMFNSTQEVEGIDRWQKTRPNVPEGLIRKGHLHQHVLPSSPGNPLYDQGIDWGRAEHLEWVKGVAVTLPVWQELDTVECSAMVALLRGEEMSNLQRGVRWVLGAQV